MYSGGGPLSRDVITGRILETLKGYDKVDPAKVWSLLIAKSVLLTSRRVFSSRSRPHFNKTLDWTVWTLSKS